MPVENDIIFATATEGETTCSWETALSSASAEVVGTREIQRRVGGVGPHSENPKYLLGYREPAERELDIFYMWEGPVVAWTWPIRHPIL